MQIQPQPEWIKPRFQNAPQGFAMPANLSQNAYAQSLSQGLQLSGTDVSTLKAPKKEDSPDKAVNKTDEVKHKRHGNAATWMTAYKFFGPVVAGIGYGGVFGVPIGFAAGISLLVSSLQTSIALKIHKGDTVWGKKISRMCRKLMGRENDHSAAGKEWSMVPVWGGACASGGLLEASINHLYSHKITRLTVDQLRAKEGLLRPLYRFQARAMELANTSKNMVLDLLKRYWPRLEQLVQKQLAKMGNNVQGKAKVAAYLVGVGGTGLVGMIQSASAAKIQERLDANAAKKQNHPNVNNADVDNTTKGKADRDKSEGKADQRKPDKSEQEPAAKNKWAKVQENPVDPKAEKLADGPTTNIKSKKIPDQDLTLPQAGSQPEQAPVQKPEKENVEPSKSGNPPLSLTTPPQAATQEQPVYGGLAASVARQPFPWMNDKTQAGAPSLLRSGGMSMSDTVAAPASPFWWSLPVMPASLPRVVPPSA